MNNARVLLTHRFYHPDVTTYAQMLRVMAEDFVANGHDVTVFSTQPGYNSVVKGAARPSPANEDGVCVIRKRVPFAGSSVGRLLGGFLFCLLLVLHCAHPRRRYDIITVSTSPPVVMGMTGLLIARLTRAKLVYHCMDLYPEIAVSAQLLRRGRFSKLAGWLDSRTAERAATVVVLSTDMKQTLLMRAPKSKVMIINNFAIRTQGDSTIPKDSDIVERFKETRHQSSKGVFTALFAGNLGRFQGLDTLVAGFAKALDNATDGELLFVGAGAATADLKDRVAAAGLDTNVHFLPHVPLRDLMSFAPTCDVGIVSLQPEIIRSAYPSKTMTYLEAGLRLICVVESDSELAHTVIRRDLGTVAPPGDTDAIARAFDDEAKRWLVEPSENRKERARSSALELFGPDRVLPEWNDLVHQLAGPDTSGRTLPTRVTHEGNTMHPDATESANYLIIVGAGRSGTNALRDALTKLDDFGTWPCDEINYIWRFGNRDFPTDELDRSHATPRIKQFIRGRFENQRRKLETRFLVEKTCANSLRVDFVDEVLPQARFVHIIRDGRDVATSAAERWTAPLDIPYLARKARFVPARDLPHYAFRYLKTRVDRRKSTEGRLSWWGPKFSGMEDLDSTVPLLEVAGRQWSASAAKAARSLAKIDPQRVLTVTYDDFVNNPQTVISSIVEWMGASSSPEQIARATKGIHAQSVGSWRRKLDTADQHLIEQITRPAMDELRLGNGQ